MISTISEMSRLLSSSEMHLLLDLNRCEIKIMILTGAWTATKTMVIEMPHSKRA